MISSSARRSVPTERVFSTASDDYTARLWRAFPDVNVLIGIVRAGLSRCLSQAQRDEFGLSPKQPTSEDRNFIPPPDERCPG